MKILLPITGYKRIYCRSLKCTSIRKQNPICLFIKSIPIKHANTIFDYIAADKNDIFTKQFFYLVLKHTFVKSCHCLTEAMPMIAKKVCHRDKKYFFVNFQKCCPPIPYLSINQMYSRQVDF